MTRPLAALPLLTLTAALAPGGAMAPPPPVALRIAVADAVLVGQVTAVADKAEKALLVKGDNREMKVATVKVETALMGKLGGTLKVGTVYYPTGRRFPVAQLTKGQEALFILTKHPTKKGVYYLANYYDVVGVVAKKNIPNLKMGGDPVAEAKRALQALRSPLTSLRAKKVEDRLFAASVLLARYKAPTADHTKTEPVPAEETRLLLTTLADADWNERPSGDGRASPQALFYQLRLTAKDGWAQPQNIRQLAPAAKKWLKDNAGKYKMTRYARDKATVEPSEEP